MLSFWGNCKLGVKLQASFALVMLVFVAAIIGIFVANDKVEALATLQSTTLLPARAAANRIAKFVAAADDDGAYYIEERRPAEAAKRLARYRLNVASYEAEISKASKVAQNETQRELIAEIRAAAHGPKSWLRGNEDAFALKAAGKVEAARSVYFAATPDTILSAAEYFWLDAAAQIDASYTALNHLETLAKTLGISLVVGAVVFGVLIAILIGRAMERAIAERQKATVATAQAEIMQADNVALQREKDVAAVAATELKLAQRERERLVERISVATEAAQIGIWDFDISTGAVIWDSIMFRLYYGLDAEAGPVAYQQWAAALHADDRAVAEREIGEAASGGAPFNTEFRVTWPNGEVHNIRAMARVVRDSDGAIERMIGTNWDVTEARELADALRREKDVAATDNVILQQEMAERKHVELRLAYAASHDELTGLANRTLLMSRLDSIVTQTDTGGNLWALLFIDLDRFKVINDSLGHALGDLVLIETARRLETCLRAGDTLARLGGDEFIILLEGIEDVGVPCQVAARLLRELAAPLAVGGHEISISASIGIATCRHAECEPEAVLRNADIAMYRAKTLGKQRYALFSPELLGNAISRLERETDLAYALERQEFCLFYQPLVAMQNGCLIGFEALVRWRHPQRGLVNPNDFISLAEETGAIIALGAWILHEACRQLNEWQSTLLGAAELRININVSAKQLASPEFFAIVKSALATSGLRAESISLEITESVMLHNADDARQTLGRLRSLGIQIHLDDFGTGYSSLSYVRDFPIDAIKIDRSFVSTADDESTAGLASAGIVRSIIALAQSLSLSVTAEGVETAAQVEALRDLGCTNMQGFYFSRPVEAAVAASMITTTTTTTKSIAGAPRVATRTFPAESVATP